MTERKIRIAGHEIDVEHADKPMFPADGLTKYDLIDYYARIAPQLLPLWRNHPVTLERFPDGIDRATLPKQDGTMAHVLVNNKAPFAYLADQACITIHLALARADRPHHPDRAIFDLDPRDDDFGKVCRAALLTKELLDELKLPSLVQTTGPRGLHVVVPLDRRADFDTRKRVSRRVARILAARHPALLTVEPRKSNRGKRVFIDYLRNGYGQTAVGPYAVRACPGAPVATPLDWHEVGTSRLAPDRYTIANIRRRLAQGKQPWRRARRANLIAAEERIAPFER